MPRSLLDSLRLWYEHECASNRVMIEMLDSVPEDSRSDPRFQEGIDLAAHLLVARENWMARLHDEPDASSDWFPKGTFLAELPERFAQVEDLWTSYLAALSADDLDRAFRWSGSAGGQFEGTIGCVLTQVNGHAWYHRGQIAKLVQQLGGKVVDTDFIFWSDRNRSDPRRL